jgi:hypothetical protein
MAKSFNVRLLNQTGQSLVEYILLLAVITSLGYTFYNNKRFKDFIRGNDGMFATMKKGISYSYRYGVEYNSEIDIDEKMNYEYQTKNHDTYYNAKKGESHFFVADKEYP